MSGYLLCAFTSYGGLQQIFKIEGGPKLSDGCGRSTKVNTKLQYNETKR